MKSTSFRRLLGIGTILAILFTIVTVGNAFADPDPALDFSPTPDSSCAAGDLPETTQGRVPLADFSSGRAAQGYTCNASQVSHVGGDNGPNAGSQGGYRVYRYIDNAGHVCAFYDTTLLFPANSTSPSGPNTGVWVLDMTDPANPVHTATLSTPAMQSPHESFSLNVERGLLGAVFANPAFYHGQFDLYDASEDCRHPQFRSSLPMGVLGHEGSFSPDGNTYYSSSLYGHTLTAIDTSNTRVTRIVWTSTNWNVHGMNLSYDGNLMYFADLARNGADAVGSPAGSETKGLTVLDVSEIQARALNPQVSVVSHLTWPHVSTPQTNLPIRIGGHPYLVEIDEFGSGDNVGAGRIIDIENTAAPHVVSNLRLAVNNADHQNDGLQSQDPNATNSLAGYTGHYCGVPRKLNPHIVACSYILSGLRVFDIRNPAHPVEIAYFNKPATTSQVGTQGEGPQGSYAMSQPAFDIARKQIWYSDGNSGFYVVQINSTAW